MFKNTPKIEWQSRTIDSLGLTLDFFADATLTSGKFEGTTYLYQSSPPILLGIWYGTKATPTAFREGFGPKSVVSLGPEHEVTVAGVESAQQIVAEVAGGTAIGLIHESDGSLGHI